ncbi:SDR family NAD(P)-dependent oxidoreductase [Alicyclobacillus sp. ALC3]|uniref:SDR family NAD(P)-dependent oxidoreductase n=1 Tax=Alicyclobacillus sp. ALC3 TaxID=2796143 RepID=UPI0023791C7D|nr:SDR family oxidoreductase [Alicyclobacillus sp. ALC3]WDL98320.1 SDR family oxidoreductase [Alicyclobacillus sp. ALC3]
MPSVVVTGSSRGLGFAMAQEFLARGYQVTISGRNADTLAAAQTKLATSGDRLHAVLCDVRERAQVEQLWHAATARFGSVDIWINNAGINQPDLNLWNIPPAAVHAVVETNLLGTIYGSQVAVQGMLHQRTGRVFNMEGFGSNDMQQAGLNLYGTTKRALTHFTSALAKETADTPVKVGLLSPGMMVTDFITKAESVINDPERSRKVFNILGDKPETVAAFLVAKIHAGTHNGEKIAWLTKRKAALRFMTAAFRKRDLFSEH